MCINMFLQNLQDLLRQPPVPKHRVPRKASQFINYENADVQAPTSLMNMMI